MKARGALVLAIFALSAVAAAAAPIEFNEISLLVRLHQPERYIEQQVKNRSLLYALTPRQEAMLTAQGAPASLLQALRDPVLAMPPEDAKEYVAEREQLKLALQQRDAAERKTAAAEAEAKARQAAALAARAPAPMPGPAAAGDSDVPYPVYYNDGGYSGYVYGRYGGHAGRNAHEFSGSPREGRQAPMVPVSPFVPSGPSGSGDRAVHALSGNAVFVPSR